jgi:hypothetical protein
MMTISCDDCTMRTAGVCGDCVVTFLLGRGAQDAIVFDVAEERALRLLATAGMVPTLRHDRQRSSAAVG